MLIYCDVDPLRLASKVEKSAVNPLYTIYLSSNSVVAWNNINTPCCQKENFEVNGVGFQPKKEWQIYICGICGITTKEKDDEGNLASSFLETHTS